ncbi:restriction endonuclease subunit S [Rhizobium leguminosarum bv. viciae]|nr:restriction endonuclease subunit S [Rhizobium leguminosarum bv. viciae]
MSGWRNYRIADLGRIVTGKTPPSSQPQLFDGTIPFITPSDMSFHRRHVTTERFVSADWDSKQRTLLPEGAVCVVCIGATIGKICMSREPSQTNQQINSVIVDRARFDQGFVYYVLRTKADEFVARAAGAATPIINKTTFSEVEIDAPSLPMQRRIASILGAYDDLIEVNQRRIAVLEEMVRGLFEEWFVRFRFPGHEGEPIIDTPDGPLPEGWRRQAISTVYDGMYDGPHATPSPSEAGAIFLGIGNITETGRIDLSSLRYIAEDDLAKWTKRVTPQEGDIVFTYEATLNRYALIPKGFRGCLGRRLALIRCNSPLGMNRYLYHYFFTKAWRDVIAKNTLAGATVDRVPLTRFPEFPITVPPSELLHRFDGVAQPIAKQTEAIEASNRLLAVSRDLLLPRLISGQLSAAQVERELEKAA